MIAFANHIEPRSFVQSQENNKTLEFRDFLSESEINNEEETDNLILLPSRGPTPHTFRDLT